MTALNARPLTVTSTTWGWTGIMAVSSALCRPPNSAAGRRPRDRRAPLLLPTPKPPLQRLGRGLQVAAQEHAPATLRLAQANHVHLGELGPFDRHRHPHDDVGQVFPFRHVAEHLHFGP